MKSKKMKILIISIVSAALVLAAVATGLGVHFSKQKPVDPTPPEETDPGENPPEQPLPPAPPTNTPGLVFKQGLNGYILSGYTGTDTDVTVIGTYEGQSVTSIAENAFSGNSEITSVTVLGGITSIGKSAFENCGKLSYIVIPEGVTSIGPSAFYNCFNLKSFTLPQSLTTLGNNAFTNCIQLVQVTNLSQVALKSEDFSAYTETEIRTSEDVPFTGIIANDGEITTYTIGGKKYLIGYEKSGKTFNVSGKGITEIAPYAVYNNKKLQNVELTSDLTRVRSNAFNSCLNIVSVTAMPGVNSVDNNAFSGCFKIVHISDYAEERRVRANDASGHQEFRNDESTPFVNILKTETNGTVSYTLDGGAGKKYLLGYFGSDKDFTVSQDYTDIYPYAFYNNDVIETLRIPKTVKSVGDMAFAGCSKLTEITFNEDSEISNVGENVFSNCKSLTTVNVGKNVKSLGEGTFENCNALNAIRFLGTKEEWDEAALDITFDNSVNEYNVVADSYRVYCEDALYYIVDGGIKYIYRSEVAGSEVLVLGSYLSKKMYGTTKVTVPEKVFGIPVVQIATAAFESVSGLDEVDIPVSIVKIDEAAFKNCFIHVVNYAGTTSEWMGVVRATDDENQEIWILPTTEFDVWCSNGKYIK